MENSITLNQVLVNILLGLASVIGTTVVPYLLVMGRKWIKSKIGAEHGHAALITYNYIAGITYDVVKATQETIVKKIKAATDDGHLSEAEAKNIKVETIIQVKEMIGKEAIVAIDEGGAKIDEIISNLIESRLKDIKSEDAIIIGGPNGTTEN